MPRPITCHTEECEKQRAYQARYYQANRDALRAKYGGKYKNYQQKWRDDNKDKVYDAAIRRKYGITLAEKEAMLNEQGGGCAICGHLRKKMVVDHDHDTGEVRGILCSRCNTMLGQAEDGPSLLERALVYLSSSSPSKNKAL